jgi:hypothetical protein
VLELCSHYAGVACPNVSLHPHLVSVIVCIPRTMWPRHLAPDHPYLRPPNLLLAPVNICDFLAQVEVCGFWVVDALDLDERCVGVRVALSSLV